MISLQWYAYLMEHQVFINPGFFCRNTKAVCWPEKEILTKAKQTLINIYALQYTNAVYFNIKYRL